MIPTLRRTPRHALWLPSLLLFLTPLLGVYFIPREATSHPGRWTPPSDWGATAVHMALIPGDGNPYHARVLWWDEEGTTSLIGGQWGWRVTGDSIDCTSYPSSALTSLGIPDPHVNIFCSGFVQLPDSRLITVGGTEAGTENGMKHTFIFAPGAGSGQGSWAQVDSMADRRWYPNVTLLNDGRVMASSGSKYPQIELFGGRVNGASLPADSSLIRFGMVAKGVWDESVLPHSQLWPGPLMGQTAIPSVYNNGIYCGGRKSNGSLTNDTWFLYRNPATVFPDYWYEWKHPTLLGGFPPPDPRAEHSAIMFGDTMMVSGGLAKPQSGPEAASSEVWWLHLHDPPIWKWEQLETNVSTGPSARYSHAAIYDRDRRRMLLYGGTGDGQNPADQTVWGFQLNDGQGPSGTWRSVSVVNSPQVPVARFNHSLEWDKDYRKFIVAPGDTVNAVRSLVLFGGLGASNQRFNDCWRLLLQSDSTVRWVPITTTGTAPAPRGGQTGNFEPGTNRLFVFGGETAGGALDDTMYVLQLDPTNLSGTWGAFERRGAALTDPSAVFDGPIFTRVPEIFDPQATSGAWSHATGTGTTLLQEWYPQTFVTPAGWLFNSGPSDTSYKFTPSTGAWSAFPTSGSSGFKGGSAVMYRPGQVMKCGTRDTGPSPTVKTTKTIDLNLGSSATWQASDTMTYARVNMNLTLLPTGEVIVTGGTGGLGNGFNTDPVKRPEIWNPTANGNIGDWYGGTASDSLNASTVVRGYHSTAILLPDARILCAGGNNKRPDELQGDIYCPPYLFNSSGYLATRPTLSSAPAAHMKWGKVFTLCTDKWATIQSACLLKPGATTHAFDMDQRYVPLGFVRATNPNRLLVTAPADSNIAPPGDYLLFMVDSSASVTSRVPSVATWLKVDRLRGRDSCDAVAPATVSNLSGCCDAVEHTITVIWTAPADDALLAASGAATAYDLRMSSLPINTENDFYQAGPVTTGPPQVVGSAEEVTLSNAPPGSTYYFRLKTGDDNLGWSAMSNLISVYCNPQGLCGDDGFYGGSGGGGGARAQRAPTSTSMKSTAPGGFSENSLLNGAALGMRATDMLRLASPPVLAGGAYQVRLRTGGKGNAAVDAVRLMVADHAPDLAAYALDGGVVTGARVAASRIAGGDGADLTTTLDGSGEYAGAKGEVLSITLASDGAAGPLVLQASSGAASGDPDSTGILVQVPDGSGAWHTVGHCYPRQQLDEIAVPDVKSSAVRLVLLSDNRLRFVGQLAPAAEAPKVQWAALASAQSNALGDAKPAITATDSVTDVMAGSDTLGLAFTAPPLTEGQVRDYFLVVDATLVTPREAALLRSGPTGAAIPTAFALRQNRPNPFAGTTTIRFELPVGAVVRFEVFDAQGRRVETLANRYFSAGYHAVEWNHGTGSGRLLGPGVYFYRIQAGPFRDRKKMVLVP